MVLLIHAHPEPDSFTSAIAAALTAVLESSGNAVRSIDLYRMSGGLGSGQTEAFPPLLEAEEIRRKTSFDPLVQSQMKLIENAEAYVVVHPDWWGGPPAVLKGWIDRVFRPGTAYEIPEGYGHKYPEGLLSGRKALVIVSGDGESPGPLKEFWVGRVWEYCGVTATFQYFPNLRDSTETMRREFISEMKMEAENLV